MNVTMTMEEYQQLLSGIAIKTEEQKKRDKDKQDLHDKEYEKGQNAIRLLHRLEQQLELHGLVMENDGMGSFKIVKKYR